MKTITAIFFLLILALMLFRPITHFGTMNIVSGVVITDKERVNTKNGSRFMVWTENEVFQNTDSWLSWKWNSADIHGKMRVGATCDLTVNGWRVPFLSWNRNVLKATCS